RRESRATDAGGGGDPARLWLGEIVPGLDRTTEAPNRGTTDRDLRARAARAGPRCGLRSEWSGGSVHRVVGGLRRFLDRSARTPPRRARRRWSRRRRMKILIVSGI